MKLSKKGLKEKVKKYVEKLETFGFRTVYINYLTGIIGIENSSDIIVLYSDRRGGGVRSGKYPGRFSLERDKFGSLVFPKFSELISILKRPV